MLLLALNLEFSTPLYAGMLTAAVAVVFTGKKVQDGIRSSSRQNWLRFHFFTSFYCIINSCTR